MKTRQRITLIALVSVWVLLAACRPGAVEPGIAPEIFITPGPTETLLLSNEEILQNNCDGGAAMSQTVERSYTVSRILELGASITVDAGGRAGIPGVGEVGVGAAVASHYNVSYGSEETVTRSVTVAAEKGANILHTVRQNMLWETGTLVVAGAAQPILYRFRKDFSMETLPPANLGCPGPGALIPDSEASGPSQPAGPTTQPSTNPVVPTTTFAPTSVRLVAPAHGVYWDVIDFTWQGSRELTYRVHLRNAERQFAHIGPWLQEFHWAYRIPGEEWGNWMWWVESSDGRITEVGTFVYDPNANLGGPIGVFDLNKNCRIDDEDLSVISGYNYGCSVGDDCFSYGADFNGDGYIGDDDVEEVSGRLGREVPNCAP